MRVWLNRLWANMNEMPGPVWAFGAWAVFRFVRWAFLTLPGWMPLNLSIDSASMWQTIGMFAGMCVGQALPLVLLWTLICKKPVAVSLTSLYAGLRALYLCVCFLMPLLTVVPDWAQMSLYGRWSDQLPMMIFECILWAAFLFYLERSKDVEQVFPIETRHRAPWWVSVVMFGVVILLGM